MKYFLSIFTLLIASVVFSQNIHEDSSANYVANWGKGEKKIFYIIHNTESYESNALKSEFSFSYEAHTNILDSTKNNYTVEWTFHLPDKIKKARPGLADSLPVYEGMKMIFKTSQTGEFIELINWQEVRDSYAKMMEISLPQKMDSAAKVAVEQSKALFNSKEMVESALIKEIQMFYRPYGQLFTTNAVSVTTQLPNPFGGEPLPAQETYKVTEINPQLNYFTLVIKQDIDKVGTQKFFEGFLKKTKMDSDKAIVEAKNIMNTFEIKDYSEYKFISSIGWPKRIRYARTLTNGKTTKKDSYIIEMKE
ncbi:hypothetical protein [Niabella ginsengisoli]|uniref:Uncharacterized protein n=1 Tax=Niabella ginsengisoli TaxID=522298 RepID=A0ABS9SF42_9BACT|nr:hypothetical protein [Niabella ginsengisoli]MCH5596982.1 hypothetical protein [Niabella ginsengisoli]